MGRLEYKCTVIVLLRLFHLPPRLNTFGYRIGQRLLELLNYRDPHPTVMTPSKNPKREVKVLGLLYFIHTQVWKACFGKVADALEKSTEHEDECEREQGLRYGYRD